MNSSRTVVDTTCKSSSEKLTEESDSDSFDPVDEGQITAYSKLGDITPTIRRMVLRGQGKNYYGVGKKPTTISEAKARGKSSTEGPQPGDIHTTDGYHILSNLCSGFFKLGLAKEPATFNDGRKVSQAMYDYCSFDLGKVQSKILLK